MGRPKGVKNKSNANQMITLKLTKQEFCLLTQWSRHHFWDDTESFQDDIQVDELLEWSRSCLLMARLKTAADQHGMHFGFDDFPKEVQDAINYADIGFSDKDILYLHKLYLNGESIYNIIKMMKEKEAFIILTTELMRRK